MAIKNTFAEDIGTWIDILESLFTIGAIVFGGVLAYIEFFLKRSYHPKISLQIAGELVQKHNNQYLICHAQLKNVGISEFSIHKKGTGIRVYGLQSKTTEKPDLMLEKRIRTVRIFGNNSRIEANEDIGDTVVLQLPNQTFEGYKLELIVASNPNSMTKQIDGSNQNSILRWSNNQIII